MPGEGQLLAGLGECSPDRGRQWQSGGGTPEEEGGDGKQTKHMWDLAATGWLQAFRNTARLFIRLQDLTLQPWKAIVATIMLSSVSISLNGRAALPLCRHQLTQGIEMNENDAFLSGQKWNGIQIQIFIWICTKLHTLMYQASLDPYTLNESRRNQGKCWKHSISNC